MIFYFNDTATTEIYTLSLHDALPICGGTGAFGHQVAPGDSRLHQPFRRDRAPFGSPARHDPGALQPDRSEEHTSELQSRQYLVCRLLLEKKKNPIESQVHGPRPKYLA